MVQYMCFIHQSQNIWTFYFSKLPLIGYVQSQIPVLFLLMFVALSFYHSTYIFNVQHMSWLLLWSIIKWFSVCLCLCVYIHSFFGVFFNVNRYWWNINSICCHNARHIPLHYNLYNEFWDAGQVSHQEKIKVFDILYYYFWTLN